MLQENQIALCASGCLQHASPAAPWQCVVAPPPSSRVPSCDCAAHAPRKTPHVCAHTARRRQCGTMSHLLLDSGHTGVHARFPPSCRHAPAPDRHTAADRSTTHVPEHANLVHNVIPVPRCLQLLRKQPVQLLAHLDDTPGHRLHIPLPLLEQLRRVQDQRNLRNLSAKRAGHGAARKLTRRAPWAGGLLISDRASTDN